MANNPLFSSTNRRRSFSYKPQSPGQSSNQQHQGQGVCHGTGAVSNGEEHASELPPAKRSRTGVGMGDGNNEDVWDDDMEFTQAELEDIEIIASQAIAKTKPTEKPDSPKASYVLEATDEKTFAKPKNLSLSRTGRANSSSSSLSSGASFGSAVTGSFHYGSSSTSSSSSLQPKSSSLSSTRTSTSISSDSSADASRATGSLRGMISLDTSVGFPEPSHSNSQMIALEKKETEIKKLKQERETWRQKMTKSQEEVFSKEGEIKILRERLRSAESDLTTVRKERIHMLDEEKKKYSEELRNWRTETESLKTQLHFKEHEAEELRRTNQELKASSKVEHSMAAQSSQLSPKRSPRPVRKILVDEKSPKPGDSNFPTRHTFMSDERIQSKIGSSSPIRSRRILVDTGTMTLTHEENRKNTRDQRNRNRPFKLSVLRSKGQLNGPELISQILQVHQQGGDSLIDRGFIELLQITPTLDDLSPFKFNRDSSSSLLSPVSQRRTSELKAKLSTVMKPELRTIVSEENYSLAIHGVCNMLENHTKDSIDGQSTFVVKLEPEFICTVSTDSENVLFILPLINDYLSSYVRMLNSSVQNIATLRSPANSSSSSKSGSHDSSVESITSSLNLLLWDSASCANNLEHLTLVALRVLNLLVHFCPSVLTILLDRQFEDLTTQDVSDMETDSGLQQETLASNGAQSSLTGLLAVKKQILSSCLRKTLFQLANPGRESQLCNSQVVVASLEILIFLGKVSSEAAFTSLLPVLTRDTVHNCLDCEAVPTVICHGLQLLTVLARSDVAMGTLCSHSDGCILLKIYGLCTNQFDISVHSVDALIQLYEDIMECLLAIVHGHKDAVVVIFESNCHCKFKVIEALTIMMSKVLEYYKEGKGDNCLQILRNGMSFLHTLSQRDDHYMERHTAVEHQYVCLVRELTKLFELFEGNTEETCILTELWEDPDQSAESEDDEPMQDS